MAANTFTLISSTTLTSDTSTITFSSIPQTYSDLYLYVAARDTATGNWNAGARIWFNSYVGTGNYRYSIDGNGTFVGYTTENNIGWFRLGQQPAASASSGQFGDAWLYIPNYKSTTFKPIYGYEGNVSASTNDGYMISSGGYSNISVAITSLSVQSNSGSFATGSTFSLYGIANS